MSYFCHISAFKYQTNCQVILNIYSLYKKYYYNGANKTKYCKHLLKTAALPLYLAISKIEKFVTFEWLKI